MAIMYSIVEGDRPELPAKFTPDLRDVYDGMMEKDPHKRPSAATILQESFLQRRLGVRCSCAEWGNSVCVSLLVCVVDTA